MKILYAIQGTGNGHITRAIEIIPHLRKKGTTDILVSGIQSDIDLPFDVKFRFNGLSFIFGKGGGVDILRTYMRMNSMRLLRDIRQLPIQDYDLIISDFEPVSCWAAILAKRACVGLSNQVATLHPRAPKPHTTDLIGKMVLEHYAPSTYNYGFHFKALDKNIFTPVVRTEVRNLDVSDKGHYTVYLPSYSDEKILKHLKRFDDVEWQVFSKHNKHRQRDGNVNIQPLDKTAFLKSMSGSKGVLCNAGFGTASEALFLQKKLCVIPMKTQFEQQCNAAMLKSMGVKVMKKLKKKHYEKLENWLKETKPVKVEYPDITSRIIDSIVEHHAGREVVTNFETAYPLFQ